MRKSNDPSLKSWIEIPEKSDFPIQNLPFGIFKRKGKAARVGVAIGDFVLDLSLLDKQGMLKQCGIGGKKIFRAKSLNRLLSKGRAEVSKVRDRVSELLEEGNGELRDNAILRRQVLRPFHEVDLLLPVKATDYTDFYSSIEHAKNVGTMFRDPDNALLPNWKHLPVGYHGRSSSIIESGVPVKRPKGQTKLPSEANPSFGPTKKLDFELEMAFVTSGQNKLGTSIPVSEAEDHIFGFALFNDWSARDIQAWEYVPLGPFLGKNFASSISPWIVTMDALEPFRIGGPDQDPTVLPYLTFDGEWNFDIHLEVAIKPSGEGESVVSRSNFKYMYWNIAQQLAHHTINGCNINAGDIYASGTISGKESGSFGSMLELTWNGTKPISLDNGLERSFLHDGDTVIMRGYAEKSGVRIGFGEVSSKVLPSD